MDDYKEILSMLEQIKDDENAIELIKSFVSSFIELYC